MKTQVLAWFKTRAAYSEDLERLRGQPSLEAVWNGDEECASFRMWLVSHLPSLAMRCRWVFVELARQFALSALDSANVTGPAVDALRACAPVVDTATAYAVETAAAAAHHVARAATHYAAAEAADEAVDAAHYARGSTYCAKDAYFAAWARHSTASELWGTEDRRLGGLVRELVPWEWVREACAADAPELLEDASA